jgi:hypothetical protein
MKRRHIIFLILSLLLFTGCVSVQATSPSGAGKITSLQIFRVNLLPENRYPTFPPLTITDQHSIQHLYDAAYALPGPRLSHDGRPLVVSCPLDRGLEYHLRFYNESSILQEMILRPNGCPSISVEKNDGRTVTDSFMHLFEQVTGLSEAKLRMI